MQILDYAYKESSGEGSIANNMWEINVVSHLCVCRYYTMCIRKGQYRGQSQTICEGYIFLVVCVYVYIRGYVPLVLSHYQKNSCPSGLRSFE